MIVYVYIYVVRFPMMSRGVSSQEYGVRHILGITAGYNGLSDPVNHPPIELTEKMVRHWSEMELRVSM